MSTLPPSSTRTLAVIALAGLTLTASAPAADEPQQKRDDSFSPDGPR